MNTLTKLSLISFTLGVYVGCSPTNFNLDDSKCKDEGCVVESGEYSFNYTEQAGRGKVDILIVNDNSASMSTEQSQLALRFSTFIQELDNQSIDYRIGMTTTDVSGAKGGQLLSFPSGKKYLSSDDSNRAQSFAATIQREETLKCEKFIADWIRANNGNVSSINSNAYASAYSKNCPSGDERGIYAANLIVENNPSSFIRSNSHLAVIFIADEDVRSGLYNNSSDFALAEKDQPNTLIQKVKSKYGNDKFNSMTVHSIIVKDNACLATQNAQMLDNYQPTKSLVSASIGTIYKMFETSNWGKSVDICSSDYTSQLGQIRSYISSHIKDIVLKCSSPKDLVVTVSGSNVNYTLSGKTLKFSTTLNPGTNVNLSYKCKSLE